MSLIRHNIFILTGVILIGFMTPSLSADVTPDRMFGDNMVLQRDMELPVWGTGIKGEKVTVEFAGVSKMTEVDENGKWQVKISPCSAGGPFEMKVTGNNEVVFKNVLVGEVWLCSGQSNMAWDLDTLRKNNAPNIENEITNADFPNLRFRSNVRSEWSVCRPRTVGTCSAVAFFFGRELYECLKVPIGLICAAEGSTPLVTWISPETQYANPLFKDALEDIKTFPARKKAHDKRVKVFQEAQLKAKEDGAPPPNNWPRFEWSLGASPGGRYTARILPLSPFGICGVIWYQGENDAMNEWDESLARNTAKEYGDLFPFLISDWRRLWGQGDFPFLFVQIAPIGNRSRDPVESTWAEVRDGQRQALKVKNTAMVVTTDICEADLHPKKKVDVGKRLALCARALAYGENLVYSGPVFDKVEFKDKKATITFTHNGSGLATRDGQLKGFAIAGPNRKFIWADAEIRGDSVVVSSGQVSDPKAIRYAWDKNPPGNLFNKEGFPASCFRTDDW